MAWEKADNTGNTYKAIYNLKRKQDTAVAASPQSVRVVTNVKTGSFDVYTTNFGAGDTLIYSYSAAQDKPIIKDSAIYNQMFSGQLKDQLNIVNSSTKQATLDIAKETEVDRGESLKKLPGYKSLGNQGNPGGGGSGGGGTSGGATATPPQYINEEPEKLKDFSQGDLTYPIDIKSDQDRITFQAVEIAKSSILDNNVASGGLKFGKERENNDVKYSAVGNSQVILPIQSTIQDDNQVNWGGDELDAIKFSQVGLFGSLANTNNALDKQLKGAFGGIVDTLKNNATEAVTALAQEATNTKNLLSRTQGKILNPNMELLFNGPQLRTFSFTFKMSPRSKKEAKNVRTIIRYFKENSAVRGGAANLFLSSPYVFKIRYMSGGARHKSINRIKVCALKSMNVNYTPLGTYMTYEDDYKTMVCYTMTLQFQEIIPILQEDYKELPQDVIGY